MSTKKNGFREWSDKAELEDLQFAIEILRIKLHSETDLSQKIQYLNQIRALQDRITELKSRI